MLKFLSRVPQALSLMSQPQHRTTVRRMVSVYPDLADFLKRYVTKSGAYPYELPVKIRGAVSKLHLFNSHDLDTANQIFCRLDYPVTGNESVFIDFGANIGLASRFFHDSAPAATIYAFEPLPANLAKIAKNMPAGSSRFMLEPVAVSDFVGTATFATEETGRYGSLQHEGSSASITVDVKKAGDIVSEIIARHGKVDLLKVDVEGVEETILRDLGADQLRRIHRICAEYQGDFVPSGFEASRYGFVTQYRNLNFEG